MHWKLRGWTLVGVLLLAVPAAITMMTVAAAAQSAAGSVIATTQVTDTIYLADGTPASGTVIVSWQAFTTAIGQDVPSGTTSATITGGALNLQLVPNAGSTPIGTYYTAVYHLNDGSVSREFWVVPASQTPVQVSAIKTTVLPSSVAMQTVSKSYVDTAIAAAVSGHPLDGSSPFVMRSGDTMTGPLVLPGDPTISNQAADKHYVDVTLGADLPVFGASGVSHSKGAVPDPGATAGSTRYLREDGTWVVPAGGGSGGSAGGALGIGTGSFGSAPIAGATADYNFLQGSGATVADISGNGNNATLSSGVHAPTWTPNGLQFVNQENVSLPAALNASETFFLGVYLTPLADDSDTAMIFNNAIPAFVSSSLDFAGPNLLYWQFNGPFGGSAYGSSGVFSPSIGVNNARNTSAPNLISGFHVLAYVLGTGSGSLDHIYIDGVEVSSYSLQGASAGFQTSGNLFLGSSGTASFTGSGLFGTMYRFAALPGSSLTAGQIQAISGQIRAEVASRGVDVTPAPVVQTHANLYAIGDSITCGYNGSICDGVVPWTSSLSLTNQPVYSVQNYGIPGITLRAVLGSEPNRVAPKCQSNLGPSVGVVFLGTNDLAGLHDGGATAASTIVTTASELGAEIQVLKGAGCRVFAGTMISRAGNDGFGASLDADKDVYDALILSTAKAWGADGVIDFAANPNLGADGANANSTFFQGDQTHPTNAGELLLAAAASNALNYYFGFNQANPHVVTAANYTMLAGDGYITSNPVANQTLTLPDCTGQSGAVYTVTNLQSTFTVGVVAGSSSQLIDGLAVGTTVSIPSNSSVSFRDVANPKNVSGCHWER